MLNILIKVRKPSEKLREIHRFALLDSQNQNAMSSSHQMSWSCENAPTREDSTKSQNDVSEKRLKSREWIVERLEIAR